MRQASVNRRFQHEPPVHLGSAEGGHQSAEAQGRLSEAATAFADPLSLTIPDPDHSVGEDDSS
jgi:hypothetical protein